MMTTYAACAEHLDEAIDEFLRIRQTAPDLILATGRETVDGETPSHCFLCAEPPVYLVTGNDSEAGEET